MKTRIESLQTKWQSYSERDKRFLMVGGFFIALFMAYEILWQPAWSLVNSTEANVKTAQKTVVAMRSLESAMKPLEQSKVSPKPVKNTVQWMSDVKASLSSAKLIATMKSMKQVENNSVELTFKSVPYDALIQWMMNVTNAWQVTMTRMHTTKTADAGIVDAVVVVGVSS